MVVHPDTGKVVAVVMVCVAVAEALVALSVNPVVNSEGSYIDRHHRLMCHQHVLCGRHPLVVEVDDPLGRKVDYLPGEDHPE